jgi:hypothetical protein
MSAEEMIKLFVAITGLFGLALLLLGCYFFLGLQKFRRLTPRTVLAAVREEMASVETQSAMVGDLSELVAWFTTQPRSNQEFVGVTRLLLEASCQGIAFNDPYTRARFLEWNKGAGELRQLVEYHGEGVPAFNGTRFPSGYGTPGLAYAKGEAVIVDDFAAAYPDVRDRWDRPYKSVLCIPVPTVPIPNIRVGVLNFDSPFKGYFGLEHMRFLRTISNLLFVAYFHAREDLKPEEV